MRYKLKYWGGCFGRWEITDKHDWTPIKIDEEILVEYYETLHKLRELNDMIFDACKETYREDNNKKV